MTMQEHEEEVRFQIGGVMLAGTLAMPERALGIVLFVHGSGSSRHSPRNCFVAATLLKADSAHCFLTCSPETKRPKI